MILCRTAYNNTPLKIGMTVSNGTSFKAKLLICTCDDWLLWFPTLFSVMLCYVSLSLSSSLEPGYYKDGEFGIRIESVVIVRPASTPNNFGDKGYLGFEHVTIVSLSFVHCFFSYFSSRLMESLSSFLISKTNERIHSVLSKRNWSTVRSCLLRKLRGWMPITRRCARSFRLFWRRTSGRWDGSRRSVRRFEVMGINRAFVVFIRVCMLGGEGRKERTIDGS